jgi:hypothetical protein
MSRSQGLLAQQARSSESPITDPFEMLNPLIEQQ